MLRYCLISLSFVLALTHVHQGVFAQVDEAAGTEELSEDEARAKAIKELEEIKQAEEAKKRQADELEKQRKQQQQEPGKTKEPKKVFKPTEEISEDRPVPFPVDI